MEQRLLTFSMLRSRAVPVPATHSANVRGDGAAEGGGHLDKSSSNHAAEHSIARADRRGARAASVLARSAAWLAAGWLVLAPRAAHAQAGPRAPESLNGDGADTHLFRPAVDSKGFFSVNGSRIL